VSSENVELVERFFENWNEMGEPPWNEVDPDAVFEIDPGSFVGGTYRGHEGIRELLRLTAEVFEEFRYQVDELIDAGDSVVVLGRIHARGVQSGATGMQQGALVLRCRDGRILAYRSYLRREEALEAAGVPSER